MSIDQTTYELAQEYESYVKECVKASKRPLDVISWVKDRKAAEDQTKAIVERSRQEIEAFNERVKREFVKICCYNNLHLTAKTEGIKLVIESEGM